MKIVLIISAILAFAFTLVACFITARLMVYFMIGAAVSIVLVIVSGLVLRARGQA